MLKPLLAFTLVAAPAAPAVPQTVELSPVPKVVCIQSKGYSAGTAFRIGPHLLLTARHVIASGKCQMDGVAVHTVYVSPKADFAILSDERDARFLKVDCDGYQKGKLYVSAGHARAMDDLTTVPIAATGEKVDGFSVLIGVFEVQPGMSGGPVIDPETMKVVGVVNAADWESGRSFSVELKSTSVCGGHDA